MSLAPPGRSVGFGFVQRQPSRAALRARGCAQRQVSQPRSSACHNSSSLLRNAAARIARVPFTISHAAAVLPLRSVGKFRLPLAALMIGSMSPDFGYFLPGGFDRVETHSLAGLFLFSWPVSIGLWLLFVRVLEQPTIAVLPEHWRTRFPSSSKEITLRVLALASAAVILGAATHVVWDSFTHRGTVVVNAIPVLHAVAFHVEGWRIRWFLVLQVASSVIGIMVLAIWAWRLPPGRYPKPSAIPVSNATRRLALAVLVAASLALAITSQFAHSDSRFSAQVFHFLIGGMTGLALAWCAMALWFRWRQP
jgi:hypothetical protein